MPVYGLIVDVPPLLYLTADHLWSEPIARADRGVDFSLSTKSTWTGSQTWDQPFSTCHKSSVYCTCRGWGGGVGGVTYSHKQSYRDYLFHKFSQKWGDLTGVDEQPPAGSCVFSTSRNWLCILTKGFDFIVDITIALIWLPLGYRLILLSYPASALLYNGCYGGFIRCYLQEFCHFVVPLNTILYNPPSLCGMDSLFWGEQLNHVYSCWESLRRLDWDSLKLADMLMEMCMDTRVTQTQLAF